MEIRDEIYCPTPFLRQVRTPPFQGEDQGSKAYQHYPNRAGAKPPPTVSAILLLTDLKTG